MMRGPVHSTHESFPGAAEQGLDGRHDFDIAGMQRFCVVFSEVSLSA